MRGSHAIVLSGCAALAAGVTATCSSPPPPPVIRASDYDRTCTQSSDCIVIDEGACCEGCNRAAINAKDQARYEAAREARGACDCASNGRCFPNGTCNVGLACANGKCCLPARAVCVAGTCPDP